MSQKDLTLSQSMFRAAGLLSLFVVISVSLLILVNAFTQPKIKQAQQQALLMTIHEVMPENLYNNDLLHDRIEVQNPEFLGSQQTMTIYRARQDDQPAGLVIETIAPNGYSGDIRLLVGVLTDGRVSGVRVLEHRETPGLGDKIELRKDKWIVSFNQKRLTEENRNSWAVKRDRGEFDQFTGATMTPRAVVGAVKRALEFAQQQGVTLYE